ncbi:MAG: hypothetical protein AAF388_17665 [Bacteroidota bacterium]
MPKTALDKACAPPLVEEFVVDSEEWDSISAALYLTRRGEVFVVALEASADDRAGDRPPSPLTVRRGEDGGSHGAGEGKRVIASWATAIVVNPDVPARITLTGLLPERNYELYAYAENDVAWVQVVDGQQLSEEEIKAYCQGKIAHYKIPRYIRFVTDFPMTVTGKIRKVEMRRVSSEELNLAV